MNGSVTLFKLCFLIILICYQIGYHYHEIVQAIEEERAEKESPSKALDKSSEKKEKELTQNIEEESEDDSEDDDESLHANHYFPSSGFAVNIEYHNLEPSLLIRNRLITALKKVVTGFSMEILSFHFVEDKNNEKSKRCFAFLSEKSHVTLHSFLNPQANNLGTLNIEFLIHGPKQLDIIDKLLPLIEQEFPKYENPLDYQRYSRWKAGLRNVPIESPVEIRNPYWEDLSDNYLRSKHNLKQKIGTVESIFQRIDIFEFVDPRRTRLEHYFASQEDSETYQSKHKELFKPNRIVFLDGVTQSVGSGVESYHEALVQPAMFTHDHPTRVAIIGGGEGATLREALKHKTVSNVTMIDIDEVMCKASAKLLYPEWNGCDEISNISSCFDDPRAHVLYEDALAWFITRYLTPQGVEPYDVIIMDALDPQDTVEFANVLYKDLSFWTSIYNALSDDGVLVAQLGIAPYNKQHADMFDKTNSRRAALMNVLEHVGFVATHAYEEGHCKFDYPWTFLVVCKSLKCNKNWHATPAQVELSIHERILQSESGPLLKYFDGATMASYRFPHNSMETVFCRKLPTPAECLTRNLFSSKMVRNEPLEVKYTTKLLTSTLDNSVDKFINYSMHHDISILERNGVYHMGVDSNTSLDCTTGDNTMKSDLFYSPMIDRHLPSFHSQLNSNCA